MSKINVEIPSGRASLAPLHVASSANQLEIVKELITQVNINSKNNFGDTPLHIASCQGLKTFLI